MNQENQPKDLKLYHKVAKPDVNKEILGATNDGSFIDSRNARNNSVRGNKRSLEKIRGEMLLHQKNPVPGSYTCIGTINVISKKVEFWCDTFVVEDPIIRIDGVIVAKSPKIPFSKNFHLQLDRNESCVGGEVFVTDDNVPPMIFNVQNMIDSLSTDPQKYFANFNPDLYSVNLVAPLDIPVFQGLENVGGGGGLPNGSYQYALRYATKEGDRTNRGPLTPVIPVPTNVSAASEHFPYHKTHGAKANVTFPTSYGIKLKFRITNVSNFDFIEVIRIENNIEGGVNYTPVTKVIGRVDIAPQEFSIREFIDPVASNVTEIVTDTEDAGQLAYIERAKTLRYHDTRLTLMNISFPSKDTELIFDDGKLGDVAISVQQKLGKAGHKDPVAHTYFKGYMGGERYGFGVQVFDPAGGKGFTQEVPGFDNYQIPDRRDVVSGNSLTYSYRSNPTAANVNGVVSKVFEVFDHVNATAKNDLCSFKNIHRTGDKSLSQVTPYCNDDPESFGAKVNFFNRVRGPYSPYGPVNEGDSNDGHKYIVNPEVYAGNGLGAASTYRPQGFGLNYFANGVAFGGISNFPKWVKSFSIVRTEAAKRVVCQGVGIYSLNPGDYTFTGNKACLTKRTNKIWFSSADILAGITSGDLVQDIISNPQNYKLQFVSPLGFFSEVFNFEADGSNPRRDRVVDMISYARILNDSGQINPTESGVGVGNYVAFNKYRNSHPVNGGAFAGDAKKLFGLSSTKVITEGRGAFIEFELDQNFYNTYGTGGAANSNFEDAGLKDWTEPFYMVNIIQDGKNVPDRNLKEYKSTGHYQKLESIIGLGDATVGQQFPLVDERWEDCIPDFRPTGSFSGRDAFVYLRDPSGNDHTWINVTYRTPAQITAIINDISLNGFYVPSPGIQVEGIYTHTNTFERDVILIFGQPGFTVPDQWKVIVKYDTELPSIVFGGDTTIGESIFSPIDRQASGEDQDEQKEKQFIFNVGFPFRVFEMNPRHYVIADTTGANQIQEASRASLGHIRQLVVMYTSESRIASHFAFNLSDTPVTQFFPATNYVIRPNRFDDADFAGTPDEVADGNNLFREYFNDYPNEYNYWTYGGFRFNMFFNSDYSKESPIDHFSKPEVGFEEITDFCTAVAPSLPRAVNAQDAPGLKTFLSQSIYYANDDQGEIKKAYDAQTSGKGENLYAICERGVCLLLTKKSILSNLNADELSVTGSDLFISGEYWISRSIGSNDEMWKGMGEGSLGIVDQLGEVVRVDGLFIPNKESVYRLVENQIKDVKADYFSKLNPVLSSIRKTDRVTGVYNTKHDEYWLQVKFAGDHNCGENEERLFVFDQLQNGWISKFDYRFDKYLSFDKDIYGMKGLETYRLDQGYKINGKDIVFEVEQVSAPNQPEGKEGLRIRINSDKKPTGVEFYDREMNLMCKLDQASKGPLYLKNYNGFEQFIPRMDQSYNFKRDRVQDRLFIYKILHNLAEDFYLVDTILQNKILK